MSLINVRGHTYLTYYIKIFYGLKFCFYYIRLTVIITFPSLNFKSVFYIITFLKCSRNVDIKMTMAIIA